MCSSLSDLLNLHCTPFRFEALVSNTAEPQFQQNPVSAVVGWKRQSAPLQYLSSYILVSLCLLVHVRSICAKTYFQPQAPNSGQKSLSILHLKLLQFIK